jgi:putative toxin-antitoxin system antitoxin component (TIGR02293 family)
MTLAETKPLSEASRIARFLGLRRWAEMSDMRLVETVETGLPISTAERIVRRIDPDGLYLHVHDLIPKATYYRRKEQGKPLTKDQSEKIFALARVFDETLRQYHGDSGTAAMFLARAHPMLDGRSPLDVAKESTAGADLVLKLLARAEAGVAA